MRAETFETACSFDPEIDKSKISLDDFVEFCNQRDITKIAHTFSAAGPTLYTIREIPHQLWESYVERGDTDAEKYKRAFICGVSSVKNLYQSNGTRIMDWGGSDTQTFDGKQVEMMKPADLVKFSPAERQEIGLVAYTHSFLPRRIGSCFQLPPMSHRMLVAQASLHAESSPTSLATPNEEPSAPEAP